MKTKFISKKINYNGSQLQPLYAYINHHLPGDSIVSFLGSCQISFDKMIDAEDIVAQAKIEGDEMLHFIIEIFQSDLLATVSLQRVLVCIAQNILNSNSIMLKNNPLIRNGDDLYFKVKKQLYKLSISIASKSAVSAMIHFAVNVTNVGTPVPTCSLKELKINSKKFSLQLMKEFQQEYISIVDATQKVRPL